MLPEIVTFWHGPMDALRQTCLRSQLAAGHKVTVYSFDVIPDLPAGVGNAEAEAILPHAFSEKLRPPQPDGSWRDWTTLQFSDFFRMKLLAKGLGLWLDADVLLLKPVEIDPARPYFGWERSRRLGNSVLYLPPQHSIITAFEELMVQDELTPKWLSLSHRVTFALQRLRGGSRRLSDLRIAIYGPPALTELARRSGDLQNALPKRSFYAVHSEPKLFFEPSDFAGLIADPEVIGLHISGKGRSKLPPMPGSLYAWATERFR
ncbi:hypothetical protein [Bradyrhizobium sp.]|uniref:hypothetical protein n=1 Tax=Bradyrhizobium sp. TaxID=376 RepID=UPI0023A4D459|nr:hypothetical protein [Bradyrhizobium sp.]MDE2378021.1 hypothetical protein [Bradyrhizobium sp.]